VNTLDKYEYRVRTEQMLEYMEQKSYKKAMEIADSIDWRKAKNAAMLCTASEIYEYNGEYEKSREILFIAYDRAPGSRKIVYRLGTLALKLNDVREATDCYEEFIAMAPKDPNQYILRYKILKSQNAPLSQQIEALEEFKKAEYVEKWAYELAKLYHEAGMVAECLEECDDLILWFSEGKYVYQAMELKMKYKPLTPLQQEKYNHRNDEKKPVKKVEPVAEKKEEKVENVEEPTVEMKVDEVNAAISLENTTKVEAVSAEEAEKIEETPVAEEESVEEEAETIEEAPAEEEAETIEEAPSEEETEIIEEAKAEEETIEEVPAEEEAEASEEPQVLDETEDEDVSKEIFSQSSKMSVEEILQNWEEKQKENAQLIQEEQERARRDKEKLESQKVEEESILPDDIRQLMEELEAEAAEIKQNKARREKVEVPEEEAVEPLETMEEETVETVETKEEEPIEESAEESVQEEEKAEPEEVEEDPFDEESFDEEAFEEVESEDFEEIEEIEEIEESEGIKLGDTQAIAISAKALMNDTVVEEPLEKEEQRRPEPSSPFDTAFIVQGRYDLEAQSEIGIKAGLTEEQKKLFSYFVPVHGMSEQIVDVLENDKRCRTRYGTSRTANLLVVGRKGSGKTVLAVDIVKAIQKNRKLKQGKVGIVTAESLNKKDVSHIIEKLHGGAIIIERASKLNKKTVLELNDLMEEQTGELLVVLEEERRPLDKMLALYPDFKKKFTSRLELPVFINDELVTFAQTYAKENGYKIDEMGILALYSRIDLMQREESIVTVADVKEIMDDAIAHSQKMTFKRFLKKLFGKKKNESSRIVLQEQDFR
jgi:tetratricopeptide (TPR) repeat protein